MLFKKNCNASDWARYVKIHGQVDVILYPRQTSLMNGLPHPVQAQNLSGHSTLWVDPRRLSWQERRNLFIVPPLDSELFNNGAWASFGLVFFFLILNLGITNTWCSVGHTKGAQKMLDEPLWILAVPVPLSSYVRVPEIPGMYFQLFVETNHL